MIVNLTPRHFSEKTATAIISPNYSGSFILHEKASSYEWEGSGQLSLKTFRNGAASYSVGKARFLVENSNTYLLLNKAQTYAISLEAEQTAESFCLFFEPGLAEEVYYSLTSTHQTLLENPDRLANLSAGTALEFFERTYPFTPILNVQIEQLRSRVEKQIFTQNWLHEQFNLIMQSLIENHFELHKEMQPLSAVRAATREELYRRLQLIRDYIEACYNTSVSLDALAEVAALSPNHLLRTFRQLFGQTPHQYLTNYRLKKACQLLTTTSMSITEIALAVGFESLGSFSWLFHRRFQMSPQLYRARNG